MTTRSAQRPLEILPGVQPSTDATPFDTRHWVAAQGIRFVDGKPRKKGGNSSVAFVNSATIKGSARTIFSASLADILNTLIGTSSYLYAIQFSTLTNITPLITGANKAVANSLSTDFATLANNPITTAIGSTIITIADTNAANYRVGDPITLSGVPGAVNGVPAANINKALSVLSIGVNSWTARVATAATSSGAGGGNVVVRASGLITVADGTNTLSEGFRVKITAAGDTGGVLAASINLEFIARNVIAGGFSVMTAGVATSHVTAAGGAGTVYAQQIAAGTVNEKGAQGYGAGKYGDGKYGTALTSQSARTLPSIWFCDRFGSNLIANRGNQSPVYSWAGSTNVAPAAVANAPTDVNYAFISDNILVTFGSGGENVIKASDINSITTWAGSSTNQVYTQTVQGAGRLLSHVNVQRLNLLFTESQTYTFRYIGLPSVWELLPLDDNIGIIAPMARIAVKGVALWMGNGNFYMWMGGVVTIIPSNSGTESTMLRYVFDNLNYSQKSKIFAWHNPLFNEVQFHYPDANSNECNRVVRICLNDFTWTPDTEDRTAAEYPRISQTYPRLISSGNILYSHETGTDNDGAPLPWSVQSPTMTAGKKIANLDRIIPDSVQTGDINVNVIAHLFPQSTKTTFDKNYPVSQDTEKIEPRISGRNWQYTLSGSALGQNWIMGNWIEEGQPAGNE